MKTGLIILGLLSLSGCGLLQGAYDSQAISECRDLPTIDERIACERAAKDAERARRQDHLSKQE